MKLNDTLWNETLLNNVIWNNTLLTDTLCNNTLLNDPTPIFYKKIIQISPRSAYIFFLNLDSYKTLYRKWNMGSHPNKLEPQKTPKKLVFFIQTQDLFFLNVFLDFLRVRFEFQIIEVIFIIHLQTHFIKIRLTPKYWREFKKRGKTWSSDIFDLICVSLWYTLGL